MMGIPMTPRRTFAFVITDTYGTRTYRRLSRCGRCGKAIGDTSAIPAGHSRKFHAEAVLDDAEINTSAIWWHVARANDDHYPQPPRRRLS